MSVSSAFFLVIWLSGFLVCIMWSCLFLLLCFTFYSFLSKEKQKQTKNIREKGTFFSISALVVQIVFLSFWGGLKNAMFAENAMNFVVSTYVEKAKMTKKCESSWVKCWPLPESKIGPSMLRNINRPIFDSGQWPNLIFLGLFKKSHSPCRRKNISKKLTKKGPIFDSKKGYFGSRLYSVYMYIYIYIYHLKLSFFCATLLKPIRIMDSWLSSILRTCTDCLQCKTPANDSSRLTNLMRLQEYCHPSGPADLGGLISSWRGAHEGH